MIRTLGILVAVASAAFLQACGEPREAYVPGSARADSAGIELVQLPASDQRLTWSFDEIYAIGGSADSSLALSRLRSGTVAADERGRVYVLDRMGANVRIVEPDGRLGGVLGRRGHGPGELSNPLGVTVATDGSVVVFDRAKSALVRWDSAGRVLDERRLRPFIWQAELLATDYSLTAAIRDRGSSAVRLQLARLRGDSIDTLVTFTRPPSNPPVYPSCPNYGVEAPPFFAPSLLWAAQGDVAAVVTTASYDIDVYRDADLIRRIRRSIEPFTVTEAVIDEAVEPITIRGCTIPAAERARVRGYRPVLPVIAEVAMDPGGRLWIRRQIPGPASDRIDVVDIGGSYLGTLPDGSPFPVAFAGDDRIVSVTSDSLDVGTLHVYRLNEHP